MGYGLWAMGYGLWAVGLFGVRRTSAIGTDFLLVTGTAHSP